MIELVIIVVTLVGLYFAYKDIKNVIKNARIQRKITIQKNRELHKQETE